MLELRLMEMHIYKIFVNDVYLYILDYYTEWYHIQNIRIGNYLIFASYLSTDKLQSWNYLHKQTDCQLFVDKNVRLYKFEQKQLL